MTSVSAEPRRRWRLLPADDHLGWTPYVWLVYLPIFVVEPIARLRAGALSAPQAIAVMLGLVTFLAAYFRGYWVRGRDLMVVIAVMCMLGVLFAPVTGGAAVFFVYGASFAGQLDPARTASRAIVVVTVLAAVTFSAVAVPIWWMAAAAVMPLVIGFVNFHDTEVRRANARLRLAQERVVHLAAVAERERIARDLHDLLGHTLSLIVLKSELAGKLMARDPARAEREIRDVETVSRDALREVRDAIRGYRATLAEEIERSRALLDAAAIRADLQLDPLPLARAEEEALALALREAVTNVVRHSGATTCTVRLRAVEDGCELTIADDGTFRRAPEGGGLRGMRERIEDMGGTVTRARAPRGGLELLVRIPRSPADAARDVPDAMRIDAARVDAHDTAEAQR